MKILIVDSTSEAQASMAARIKGLNSEELDTMDVGISLSHPGKFSEKLDDCDLLILGPELQDMAQQVAAKAKSEYEDLPIIRFVPKEQYSEGQFRVAYQSRVRKVLSTDSSDLDILQEIVSIFEEMCAKGKRLRGKSIVVTQAKGGVGATTISAALGQACASYGCKTLLWDFDIESRDLSRALGYPSYSNSALRSFLDGSNMLSRETFKKAIGEIENNLSILVPPDTMAACMDLVGLSESIPLAQRLFQLANATFENVIIDTAGRFSPTTCALMLTADINLIVIDDSVLGMSAVDPVVRYILSIVPDHSKVRFLCSGTALSPEEIAESLNGMFPEHNAEAWSLPTVPFDKAAQTWPLSPGSLYESGSQSTKSIFQEVARQLQIIPESSNELARASKSRNSKQKSFKQFVFQRVGNLSIF